MGVHWGMVSGPASFFWVHSFCPGYTTTCTLYLLPFLWHLFHHAFIRLSQS